MLQVVAPGPVNTDMLRLERQTSFSVPTADTYVRSAGRHIGYEAAAVPYPKHAYDTCACLPTPPLSRPHSPQLPLARGQEY